MEKLIISHYINDDIKYIWRQEFYNNRWTKYWDYCVHVIDMFIFNQYGEVLIQKRGKHKVKMPGLLHTSVWGHVNEWELPSYTVFHECMEEIWVPSYLVMDNDQDFKKTYTKLKAYSDRFVLTKHISSYKKLFDKFSDGAWREEQFRDMVHLYFWLYDWPVQFLDRAADGFERFSMDDLKNAITDAPERFTLAMLTYFPVQESKMRDFVSRYCKLST